MVNPQGEIRPIAAGPGTADDSRAADSFQTARHFVISRNSACGCKAGGTLFLFLRRLWWLAFLAGTPGFAAADKSQEREPKGRGFSYLHDKVPGIPWSIHVLKVERSHPDFEFHTTLAKGTIALGTMTEQTRAVPPSLGKPIAAINGDFWNRGRYDGDPEGLQIMRGELISAPGDRSCFWIDTNGQAHATNVLPQLQVTWPNNAISLIGLNEERTNRGVVLYTSAVGPFTRTKRGRELILEREGQGDWLPLRAGQTYSARVREVRGTGNSPVSTNTMVLSLSPQSITRLPNVSTGALLRISTGSTPGLRGVQTAIGGGPALVRQGKMASFTGTRVRHPRAAVGWNDKFFFFVVVDGRQPKLSVGMSLQDLATYLIKLGCEEALNLDGGGSATFWIYGNVINSPCYGRERPMANALVLVQKPSNQNGSRQSTAVHDALD
jgi:hypothetical protein